MADRPVVEPGTGSGSGMKRRDMLKEEKCRSKEDHKSEE